jgi:hypothetical protein
VPETYSNGEVTRVIGIIIGMHYDNTFKIKSGCLTCKVITNDRDKLQAYKLRHEVYCEELRRRPLSADKLELENMK